MDSCFLVGEIGINHNGDLNLAKDLIKEAKTAGFDAVKFQKRDIDVVYSQDYLNSKRESPWGNTQRVQKEALEFSLSEYWEIDNYCKELDIEWFVSCWDINSQIEMRIFSTKWNKVASAMATNIPFLEVVASEQKHTFVSTGMTSLKEIEECIQIFNKFDCPITLLHTVSTYPAEEADLNLSCITVLKDKFNLPVGYSGHETGVSPSVMAVVLGSVVVERHITLNRAMYGSDQAASLEPQGMRNLCSMIKKVNICMGDGVKRIIPAEMQVAKKLRYWNEN
ncbi:N-acetylneuraminate synthase family protein [Prochlorococcus sp. AH-716-K03]|nr:N-acetylneuraminate synthase family protein [Prochlorococcus sp. AH-716-K03]|tara:strand:+ start:953 stop:1792 length:840 start_codon:yes stop_codon:yes gene_type:complete